MNAATARARSVDDTRQRILDIAIEVLGRDPDAGMGEIAATAGVVRRTVYGHFPARADLVRTLAERAAGEMVAVLDEVDVDGASPPKVWVEFVARLWPLAHRYRVLLTLRRGQYGDEIHALLQPVDDTLADLVRRGQDAGVFGRHLPASVLSRITFAAVFAIADSSLTDERLTARAAATTSLLLLGVTAARARALTKNLP